MSPIEITWLGQSALVIRVGADLLVVDAGNAADPEDLVRHVRARGGSQIVLVPGRNRPFMIGVPA